METMLHNLTIHVTSLLTQITELKREKQDQKTQIEKMGIKIDDLVNRNEDLLKDSKDSESTIIKLTAENKQLNESVGQLMIEKAKITKDFNDANGKLLEDVKNLSK